MPMSITILLADDHAIMRQGLTAILQAEADLKVVGEASNGREVVDLATELCPDIVVMDIGMPDLNGVEATRQLLARDPKVKVIALSAYTEKQFVLSMLEVGACAYVVKASASEELLRAIRAVTQHKKYLSPEVADAVVDSYLGRLNPGQESAFDLLSPREREVLQLVAEGKTSKMIGVDLGISENTVEIHRRNIMQKLNLHSVAELTKYAVRHGITTS
jgi:DNA-binding NarL/FixJ family response regulator